ncbi:MAG: glycoside hydrolase family 2 [Pedobacter sp.]|nr:glycoside hydrolase family 2 [Pedobacter sp.]
MLKNNLYLFFLLFSATSAFAQRTEIKFLSGTGKDHTVNWDFQCTAGTNSSKWTTIPVPSNWESMGFGNLTYGSSKEDTSETGLYRHKFNVSKNWVAKEIFIVFDGSMTDTEVKVNGVLAGPVHQGAFYRFRYNITPLLKFNAENLLEVKVRKVSSNQMVNEAERSADFWVFGGIFRPVFLEAYPKMHLERIAVDARADGSLKINAFPINTSGSTRIVVQLKTRQGKPVGAPVSKSVTQGQEMVQLNGKILSPKLWSPEFPNLYTLEVSVVRGTKVLHTLTETIGFRTVELRKQDGFYVNGKKMRFKGVNRGSFWPTSGRTTDESVSLLDAKLIKEMNMNAVRMSHYPPDAHFLKVCDSIGLFVIDELTGWQYPPYDTQVGRKLVKELILKDVNHPSVIMWANGNEGGFNFELLPEYPKHDIQARPVIQPWMNINGMNTKHYIPWNYGINTFFQGKDVFFPTEFLHGLYDGGHGAGLDDFWNLMLSNPLSAGGFLWDFCDQGVANKDRNGQLDTKGNAAADGILGPYREKEGSFYTIKEIWAPVYFPNRSLTKIFDGSLAIENRYNFTNLNQCKFSWKLKKITGLGQADTSAISGKTVAPDVSPQSSGTLKVALPNNWTGYDILYITAKDPYGQEIFTWSWPLTTPHVMSQRFIIASQGKVQVTDQSANILIEASGIKVEIDKKSGQLIRVNNKTGEISFKNGPVLITGEATDAVVKLVEKQNIQVVEVAYSGKQQYKFNWTLMPSGILQLKYQYKPENNQDMLGISFDYSEEKVKAIQLIGNGPYRVYKNRMKGTTFNSWNKVYNNTITGESWDYPEFKGYYSNFYAAKFQTNESDFTIFTETENLFLHLFNPAIPKDLKRANSMAVYPKSAGISFMHGITAIGTKTQEKEDLGPQSQANLTFANGGLDTQSGVLYFDFRAQ